MDQECLQNTNSKRESAYRMIILLPLSGVTYLRFPFPVCFYTKQSANILDTVGDEERQQNINSKPGSNCRKVIYDISSRWRHLPPTYISGPF